MQVCPICHSPINVTSAQEQELRSRGIYVWTDDPLLTEQGLAGDQYKGLVFFNYRHIKEIQDARKAQETSAGISPKTTFSEISAIIEVNQKHIEELRWSTERILSKLNSEDSTRTIDLKYYFNYDRDGGYHGTYTYGEKLSDKIEWTDIDRTTGKPSLPSEVFIRAIHIEELRHPIPVVEIEEEPYFYNLWVNPSIISFNLRCLDEPPEKEIIVYGDGVNVTTDAWFSYDSDMIELIYRWDYVNHHRQVFVKPLKIGNTTIEVSHPNLMHMYDPHDPENPHYSQPAIVSIYISDAVYYVGDLEKVTETRTREVTVYKCRAPIGYEWQTWGKCEGRWGWWYFWQETEQEQYEATFWKGSAEGCDGTTMNVTWLDPSPADFKGTFDGVDFNIPLGGMNWYSDFYVEDPPGTKKFIGRSLPNKPISDPPEYMEGTYKNHMYNYTLYGIYGNIYYAIGNYRPTFTYVDAHEEGNWWYVLEDVNKDGQLETYVLHIEETSTDGEFSTGWKYYP